MATNKVNIKLINELVSTIGKNWSDELDRKLDYGTRSYKTGLTNTGKKASEETKLKLRIARSARIITEDTKIKLGNTHRGMKRSQSAKDNISASLKGRVVSEEAKINMSIAGKRRCGSI